LLPEFSCRGRFSSGAALQEARSDCQGDAPIENPGLALENLWYNQCPRRESTDEFMHPVPSGDHDHHYYHPHLSAMQANQPVAPDAHSPEATGFFY